VRTPFQIVAAHYAASDRHDLERMMADLAPDVRWTEMAGFPCAGTFVGREAIVANVFSVLGRDWKDFGFTLERLVDGGDTVVGIGEYAATHRGTGKPMKARVVHVWQVEDGTVRRFEQFCDTLLVERASSPD
jgi:ketosteroid isomerase-like protein